MPLNTERKENRQWPILACASVKDLRQTDARRKGHFCPRQFQAPDRRASQSRPTHGPTRQSTGTDARIMNPDLLSAFNERETCVNSQVCPYVLKHIKANLRYILRVRQLRSRQEIKQRRLKKKRSLFILVINQLPRIFGETILRLSYLYLMPRIMY